MYIGDPDARNILHGRARSITKTPTFCTSQPEVWFAQAEAQFTLRGITADETKYFYVLSSLDEEMATQLLDLISSPATDNKYITFKDHLMSTFGLNKCERASRLLHFRPLGDSKPSMLMDEMLALLGNHTPCLLFEQLLLQRIPEDMRIQLVDAKFEDHCELVRRAGILWSSHDIGETLITHAIECKSPATRQWQPDKRNSTPDSSRLCYYHHTFGEVARQCRQPCTWSGNDKASC